MIESRIVPGYFVFFFALGWAGCGVSQELYVARQQELARCQRDLSKARVAIETQSSRAEELEARTLELRDRLRDAESDRSHLSSNLASTTAEIDKLRRAQASAERQRDVYRGLLARLKDMIDSRTLEVQLRKGRMLVNLGEGVLFDPGKAVLRSGGEEALRQVASALREIPDREFLVAGHTDNLGIASRSAPFKSNWELSTARAVTVVRFLQAEGVDPRRLGAAGYSEFDAIADNSTPQGRARNRRIEIVVVPNLEDLGALSPELEGVAPASPTSASTAPPSPPPSPQE